MRKGHLSALIVLATMTQVTTALAQSSPFDEGVELQRQSNYEDALRRFEHAEQTPLTKLHIAQCEAALGRLVEAQLHFGMLEQDDDVGADAKEEASRVTARLPRIRIVIEPVTWRQTISSVQLEIDGQPESTAIVGLARPINPGKHTVRATAQDYTDAEQTFVLAEQDSLDVRLFLHEKPQTRPQRTSASDRPRRRRRARAARRSPAVCSAWCRVGSSYTWG
jgi:hypothetical protein